MISQQTGVNFTNVLCAAFTLTYPQSAKRHWRLESLFSLLGSVRVKVARKHVDEIDPWGLNFINVLRTAFTPVVPQSVRNQSSRQYLFTLLGPTSVKVARKRVGEIAPKSLLVLHLSFESLLQFFTSFLLWQLAKEKSIFFVFFYIICLVCLPCHERRRQPRSGLYCWS